MLESQHSYAQTVSFEFFPPKTDQGSEKLKETARALMAYHPEYFSVTYGACGTTQEKTMETVFDLSDLTKIQLAPHLTCVGSKKDTIQNILANYENHGIDRIVALRGDLPPGMSDIGELHHASDLVNFIRDTTGDYFTIDVGAYPECHPESLSAKQELEYFKEKVDAGVNGAITQYFFSPDAYYHFVDECEKLGIEIPIVPGIMPIYDHLQLERFSDMCGAELPRWLRKQLESRREDKTDMLQYGVDIVSTLCQNLLDAGAPGVHFYTLNRSDIVSQICDQLQLKTSD